MSQESMPKLMTLAAVCELLDISSRTARRWASAGLLPPPVRLAGQTFRWRESDIRRWIHDRATAADNKK